MLWVGVPAGGVVVIVAVIVPLTGTVGAPNATVEPMPPTVASVCGEVSLSEKVVVDVVGAAACDPGSGAGATGGAAPLPLPPQALKSVTAVAAMVALSSDQIRKAVHLSSGGRSANSWREAPGVAVRPSLSSSTMGAE